MPERKFVRQGTEAFGASPGEISSSELARRDFSRAVMLAETLDPKQKISVMAAIGLDQARSGFDPKKITDFLLKASEGLKEEKDFDKFGIERDALYGLVRIVLEEDPTIAFRIASGDPYPGHPFQPKMDLEIARAFAKKGLDPDEPLERAKRVIGQFAPYELHTPEETRLEHEILVAETICIVGRDPMPLIAKIGEKIKKTGISTIIGSKGIMRTYEELAKISARHGDMQTAYDLVEGQLEDYKQFEIRRLKTVYRFSIDQVRETAQRLGIEAELIEEMLKPLDDKIREIETIDQSESRSERLFDIAQAALEGNNIKNALEAVQKGGGDLQIAEIAARAAILTEDNNQAEELISLALEKADAQSPKEIADDQYKQNNYNAKRVLILALVGQVAEKPIPIFKRAADIAIDLEPDKSSFRSFRSDIWNKLARSIAARGLDATFAFKQAVSLLELQNGPLIAGNVGSGNYFKEDMFELVQSQLEAGYFGLAESTVEKFRDLDTENRYFKALFLSKRALARTIISSSR